MPRSTYISLLLVLFCCQIFSQEKKPKPHRLRIESGIALAINEVNKNHTTGTHNKPGLFAGLGGDFKIGKTLSFCPMIEIFHSGLTFNSYYFAPNYDFLYDKSFHYNYDLTINETRLNFGIKQNIGLEKKDKITGYYSCAFALRALLSSNLVVTSNLTGAEMYTGNPGITFEHPLLQPTISEAVKFGTGFQVNNFMSHKAWIFGLDIFCPLSRFYLYQNFTPSSLYINTFYIQLSAGLKI